MGITVSTATFISPPFTYSKVAVGTLKEITGEPKEKAREKPTKVHHVRKNLLVTEEKINRQTNNETKLKC